MILHTSLLLLTLLANARCSFLTGSPPTPGDGKGDRIANLPPTQDPFYVVPANISQYPVGFVIRSRKLPSTTSIYGDNAGDTYQLLFRTNLVHLDPDASVTTIVAPKTPADGPPRIVAIASPTDMPTIDCSASWALYPDSKSKVKIGGGDQFSHITAKSALFKGYYVTLPDQEGSKSGYLAYSEGQVMLDSIRAIVNFKQMIANSTGYKAALLGYSGGAHSAGWAGQLASTYGRGINIAALVTGGIPVDLGASLTYLDGTPSAGVAFAGLAGLANVYPKYDQWLSSILKPNGTEAFKAMRNGSECLIQTGHALAKRTFQGSVNYKDPLNSPISVEILRENYLGMYQKPITNFPVYLTHSQKDEIVIYGPTLAYFQSQCANDARIYFTNPKTGSHLGVGAKSFANFFYFIKQAFDDTLNLKACHQTTEFMIPFNGLEAIDTVGLDVVNSINMLSIANFAAGGGT